MTVEIHVAVGVIIDGRGRILIARRRDDLHQGGLWEFPGGKVENGESVTEALTRELQEELGIAVGETEPLLDVGHDYGDRHVLLDVHRVLHWEGQPRGVEGQPLAWVLPSALDDFQFPEANVPIAERLQMEATRG
ncbi:MAG: 8-oxo-dGTP diphosphatase MutT [Luminiphilus sp.]|nr:8-oxo-dGTP diphosphatase MutT [Luminiphilus sp.]